MDFGHVKHLVDRALADGKLSAQEHDEIEAAIDADGVISDEEMALLDMVAEKIRSGEIQLVTPAGEPIEF
ncbi:MAG: hypothetical protein NW237_16960 [Cyanobacteriota bacterium]|nr:hypothetical protein [Cyanobacteriota bacterium]